MYSIWYILVHHWEIFVLDELLVPKVSHFLVEIFSINRELTQCIPGTEIHSWCFLCYSSLLPPSTCVDESFFFFFYSFLSLSVPRYFKIPLFCFAFGSFIYLFIYLFSVVYNIQNHKNILIINLDFQSSDRSFYFLS